MVENTENSENLTKTEQPKKSGTTDNAYGLIAAIIAMIAVIALIIYGTPKLVPILANKSTDVDRQLAYIQGDILYYVKDMTAAEVRPVPIIRITGEKNRDEDRLAFSTDGKYLYFRNGIDSRGKGSLCRITVSDIRNDININENCVIVLASDVLSFEFPEGDYSDHVIMESSKGDLMIYDGSGIKTVASKCKEHVLSQNGVRVFYQTRTGEVGFYNIRKKTNTLLAQLDVEKEELWELSAGDMIYCVAHDDLTDVFKIDVKEGKTYSIAKDCAYIAGWDEDTETLCYVTSRETERSAYSMVDDLWNEADYDKACDIRTYMSGKAVDVLEVMEKADAKYYKKHKKKIKLFYEKLLSEGEKPGGDEGYRLLEKKTGECFVYSISDEKWHRFDRGRFDEACARAALKESLEAETYKGREYALHILTKEGSVHDIAEGICLEDVRYLEGGIALYRTAQAPTLMSMDDIEKAGDVLSYYNEYPYNIPDEMMYATPTGSGIFDLEGDSFLTDPSPESDYLAVYAMTGDAGNVSVTNAGFFRLQDGVLTKVIGELGCTGKGQWVGDQLFFPVDGELRSAQKDKMHIELDETDFPVYRYEFGFYLVLKDVHANEGSLGLVTETGEWIDIAEDVIAESYTLIYEDQIVFIKDGDLTVFFGAGNELKTVAADVSCYACFGIKPEIIVTEGFF